MTDQQRPSATALDAIIPTNPLAAFSCYGNAEKVVMASFRFMQINGLRR